MRIVIPCKTKADPFIDLHEAAKLAGISYSAMRSRVHEKMINGRVDELPIPVKDGGKWVFLRSEFLVYVRLKNKLRQLSAK